MGNSIHHVTAIAGPARRNLDFYTDVLGLRLVKKTVNFDDPTTYHLYYGDEVGTPGTVLTFFPWEHAAPGRLGPGETDEILLRIPEGSLGFWTHRLLEKGVNYDPSVKRFGETLLPFKDPDGMRLAFAAIPGLTPSDMPGTPEVPSEHAILGLHGVSLLLETARPTAAILTDVFGFREIGREGAFIRYRTGKGVGSTIDLREVGGFPRGRSGRGTVHHVAFRAADDREQQAMVAKLVEQHGRHVTEQKDRNYFRSVYFREPGGVLFEIATDAPGFAVDEPADRLGEDLKLPPGLEEHRGKIEAVLPALD
ncbi:diguanylate cyclase [Agaricicola taiwanensis]|uniref:Diguanylate cyclase n=1 Tax=Agaricicola taiwanensis TaxID=591372 RepID=A0A8J2YHQ5_9RHOB|nr:ring-cleaving dioxygenase [Agaricicola taiwanensis]GGE43327.1 diguanylate cyclase [Agaricicola taiwanensis]